MKKITRKQAQELLNTHTNKITTSKETVDLIIDCSPPNIQYRSIKHRLFHIITGLLNVPICKNIDCNEEVKWDKQNQKYTDTCGYKCSNKLTAALTMPARKETNKKRYGGPAPACSAAVREKMKETNISRYGDDYINVIADKSRLAIIDKFGVSNISERSISNTTRILLGDRDYLYREHITKKQPLQVLAQKLSVSDTTVGRYLREHGIEIKRFFQSKGEIEIQEFLAELGIYCITNTKKIIPPHELDIFIPEYNIAIEYNGLYWHSEKCGKSPKYHLIKTEICEKHGIRLIHIFEDEWRDMQQQCKDTLKHFFGKSDKGVYARKTHIKEITWRVAKKFLSEYHLLGAGTAGNYRIGCFDKNECLIGVMVFGHKNNEGSDNTTELKRFVTNKKNNPGIASKMFKYAIQQKQYDEVVAFVDRRWFTGLVKSYIGFEPIDKTPPALWWTDGHNRFHRRFKTKEQLIRQGADALKSKRNILSEQKIYRIWDSGKIKLLWRAAITSIDFLIGEKVQKVIPNKTL